MIISRAPEFHRGDRVVVHRESAHGVAENAPVVKIDADHSLHLEFAGRHRCPWHDGHVELCTTAG
ncbi:hypothetical protein ACFVHB_10035 [Kitasatospora sp. NPDC127111]|uniref:hypothetical protein n=1 Tax=Kitasatospora sp. NPDC127111 TaxID=3345363 RepID=UPI00362508A4